jgi:hypothetical protein
MAQFDYGHPAKYKQGRKDALSVLGVFVGADSTIPLDIVWPYLLIGLAAGVALLRSGRDPRGPVMAILLVQWLNVAALMLATMASTYRYVNFLIPLSMILIAWFAADLLARRARSRELSQA